MRVGWSHEEEGYLTSFWAWTEGFMVWDANITGCYISS